MPARTPAQALYLHLLRSAEPLPAACIDAALRQAGDDEDLVVALLGRRELDAARARTLAGPPARRTTARWLAWLSRPDLQDIARLTALAAETRVTVLRALAAERRAPAVVLGALGEHPDRVTRLAVVGNASAPAQVRLQALAGFDADLRAGWSAACADGGVRNARAHREALIEAVRHLDRTIRPQAVMVLVHPDLLRELARFEALGDEQARRVAKLVVVDQLEMLRTGKLSQAGREVLVKHALNVTASLLMARSGAGAPPADVVTALRSCWEQAALTDPERYRAMRSLAPYGIDVLTQDTSSRQMDAALAWADESAAGAQELAAAVVQALGSDPAAWAALEALVDSAGQAPVGHLLNAARGIAD